MWLADAAHRLYADFFMPSRLGEFEALLSAAIRAGYRIAPIETVWRDRDRLTAEDAGRLLILRHDIDTDPATAAAMWEIERRLDVRGSWYFRLSTLDVPLMRAIAEAGGEVGYHYEELATLARNRAVVDPVEARALLPEARRLFRSNLDRVRAVTGLPIRVVASHGDFVNRVTGVANREILDDANLRAEAGVDLEAYDPAYLELLTSRHSDTLPPRGWIGEEPRTAIERGDRVIQVLVHPRHWRVARAVNARDDLERAASGASYRARSLLRRRAERPRSVEGGGGATGGLRIAMALYADITFDSRVQREAEALVAAGHSVTIFCLSGEGPPDAPFRVVARRPTASAVLPDGSSPFLRGPRGSAVGRIAGRVRWVVGYARNLRAWGRWAVDSAGPVDAWHVHDLTGLLAVGPRLPASAQLIYDSHEIFLETGTAARLPRPARRLLGAYERRLVRRATALVTVNDEYAAVLRRRVRPARIVIVRNCPPRWEPPAEPPSELRRAVGLTDDEPLLLYHGSLTQHRGIEQLIEAMLEPGLEAAHLVLLGFGGAREELATRVADPRLGGRVHLLPAVPPGRLLDWIAGATIDVIPLQRSTLNHWLCTPNKLWESIAAGVPVVVSNFPAMAPIVLDDDHGVLGATCDPASPEAIAVAIRRLLDAAPAERAALRARCLAAAHDRWNWERESARLVELYAALRTLAGGVSPSAVP